MQGYRYVSPDREDVRIPILGASSFLEKTGLASMSCTVLAVAVMPTYEQNAKLLMISSLGTHDGFLSVDSHETVKVVVTERAIKQLPNTVLCFM